MSSVSDERDRLGIRYFPKFDSPNQNPSELAKFCMVGVYGNFVFHTLGMLPVEIALSSILE